MEKSQYYGVMLDDYRYPRHMDPGAQYFGTYSDLRNLAIILETTDQAKSAFKDFINGVRSYPKNQDMRHTVGGIKYPVLMPAQKLYEKEFYLINQKWYAENYHNAVYPCSADSVLLKQALFLYNDRLIIASKASVENLFICYQNFGWVGIDSQLCGFPGLARFCGGDCDLLLYEATHTYKDLSLQDSLIRDIETATTFDLGFICHNIVGVG